MADDADKKRIILIYESARESWLRDASTYALFIMLVGTGWLLDSQALQWVGAIVGFTVVLAHPRKQAWRFTLTEARAELDRLEARKKAATP